MISSFLLQDIPRHPDTRLFEVREAFKRSLLLGFQARIRAYIAGVSPPAALRGPSGGPCGGLRGLRRVTRAAGVLRVALRATDAEPLINALVHSRVQTEVVQDRSRIQYQPAALRQPLSFVTVRMILCVVCVCTQSTSQCSCMACIRWGLHLCCSLLVF